MKKNGKLKIYEYQDIFKKYFDESWSISQISTYLGRNKSTVSRVLSNRGRSKPGNWNLLTSYEKGSYSYESSKKRMSSGRSRFRLKTKRIQKVVIFILCKWQWSPETISDFLNKYGVKISAKAIYNFIKKERPALIKELRFKGKLRRQRVGHPRGLLRTGAPERKSIHERPEIIVNGKVGPGHWEIDTILSPRNGSGGVLTIKELASIRSFYFLIPDLTASSIMKIVLPFFQNLTPEMRKTLTADNGSENSDLYKLEKILSNFSVYYCDPYKSWQRARVENSNGDLRRFFPKKTDFSKVSDKELKIVDYKISGRPRKTNNGVSAKALFNQLQKAA